MKEMVMFEDGPEKENTDTIFGWVHDVTLKAKVISETVNSTQPFSIPRNEKTNYLQKVDAYMTELQNGTFMTSNVFDDTFLAHTRPEALDALRGLPEMELRKQVEVAIGKYLLARNNPGKYDFVSRKRKITLASFLYEFNEITNVMGISPFLQYYSTEVVEKNDIDAIERMLNAVYGKDLPKMYRAVYNNYEEFTDDEKLRAAKSILSLCRWWKRNESRLKSVYQGKVRVLFPRGMDTFLKTYLGGFISANRYQHPISLYPEKKHWGGFVNWMDQGYGIDLEAEENLPGKEKKEISAEEIQRRMDAE